MKLSLRRERNLLFDKLRGYQVFKNILHHGVSKNVRLFAGNKEKLSKITYMQPSPS
jgi:hypothetical protein